MGGTSLVVQWLWLHTPIVGGVGSIPGQETINISHMLYLIKRSHATAKDLLQPNKYMNKNFRKQLGKIIYFIC